MMRFIVRKTKKPFQKQKWYWVLVASNNEVLCTSEMYLNKSDARSAIALVKSYAHTSPMLDPN